MIRCVGSRRSRTFRLRREFKRSYATSSTEEESVSNSMKENAPRRVMVSPSPPGDRSIFQLPAFSAPFSGKQQELSVPLDEGNDTLQDTPEVELEVQGPPDLPTSPFLDEAWQRRSNKVKKTGKSKANNRTKFQSQLKKNPYALALATPIRSCSASNARLPNFFMQPFNLMAHPETNEPWWVPSYRQSGKGGPGIPTGYPGSDGKLVFKPIIPEKEIAEAEDAEDLGVDFGVTGVADSEFMHGIATTPTSSTDIPPQTGHDTGHDARIGRNHYIMARKELVEGILRNDSGYGKNPWRRVLMEADLVEESITRKLIEKSHIRSDMDTFILESMRRIIREHLSNLLSLRRGYIARSKSWPDAIHPKRQGAAILWTGYPVSSTEPMEPGASQLHGPPEFATFDATFDVPSKTLDSIKRRKLPVYNLRRLLGTTHLQMLKNKQAFFNEEILVLKRKLMTVNVQLCLWKLEGYLARHEEFMTLQEAEEVVSMSKKRQLDVHAQNEVRSRQLKEEQAPKPKRKLRKIVFND